MLLKKKKKKKKKEVEVGHQRVTRIVPSHAKAHVRPNHPTLHSPRRAEHI